MLAIDAAKALHNGTWTKGELLEILGDTVRVKLNASTKLQGGASKGTSLGRTVLHGSEEYIVKNAAMAERELAALEARYTAATKGLKPKTIPGDKLGKPAWIDLETGQIYLNDAIDPGFRQGYLAEELNHYFQLQEKGLLGPGKVVSAEVEKALEADVVKRVEQMGFEKYNYRNYAPYTDVPRPLGVAGNSHGQPNRKPD